VNHQSKAAASHADRSITPGLPATVGREWASTSLSRTLRSFRAIPRRLIKSGVRSTRTDLLEATLMSMRPDEMSVEIAADGAQIRGEDRISSRRERSMTRPGAASRARPDHGTHDPPTCPSCAAPAGPTGRTALLGGTALVEMARWSCEGPARHWWDEFRVIVDF
jgi:hypothetical protein